MEPLDAVLEAEWGVESTEVRLDTERELVVAAVGVGSNKAIRSGRSEMDSELERICGSLGGSMGSMRKSKGNRCAKV